MHRTETQPHKKPRQRNRPRNKANRLKAANNAESGSDKDEEMPPLVDEEEELGKEPQKVEQLSKEPKKVEELSKESQKVEELSKEPKKVEELSKEPKKVEELSKDPKKVEELGKEPQKVEDPPQPRKEPKKGDSPQPGKDKDTKKGKSPQPAKEPETGSSSQQKKEANKGKSPQPRREERKTQSPQHEQTATSAKREELLKLMCGAVAEDGSPMASPDDAIKVIQQALRAKFLKQSQKMATASTNRSTSGRSPQKEVPSKDKERKETKKNEVAKAKPKETEPIPEKSTFIEHLQKKMESAMANGRTDLPHTLLDNLQKLFNQEPLEDIVSSDDEAEEYIEYIYKPRQYFLVALCNHCKSDLRGRAFCDCKRCHMTYYCSPEHQKSDVAHRQLCNALRQVAAESEGHIFHKCGDFSTEQFRMYRIVTIRKVEAILERPLTATEQEVVLFPRLCRDIKCREHRFAKLDDCKQCGMVAYCKDNAGHLNRYHNLWCRPYQLFKELVMFQEKYGRLDPSLPHAVLPELPADCTGTKEVLHKLGFDMKDACEYAALSQVSTGPLTAWYALKLCNMLKTAEALTIHLIGAEIEFEVDILHKWELFFMHITPATKKLNVVFVGPELVARNISFDQLKKTKCCRACRKQGREVSYHFESHMYHDYCKLPQFLPPNLICFFNAGLYRCTGYNMIDSWPETILAAAQLRCPVVVTSYTKHEAPMDMARYVQESNRSLNVVMPPTVNPFASEKPERNFISDEDAPLMFKNYYCFVVE